MPIFPIIVQPGRRPACPCWAPLFPQVYQFCDPRLPLACAPTICCPPQQRPPQQRPPVRPVPPIGQLPPGTFPGQGRPPNRPGGPGRPR